MDSFEASTKLNQILRSLTPSLQNLTRAAHFALKNAESEDYLFHSIIDSINDDAVELNTKSTIFQFIEVLIHESTAVSEQPKSHYNYPYIHSVKNSLPRILLKVLPGSNITSLHNIYTSLKNISKTFKIDYDDYELKYNSIQNQFNADDLKNLDLNIPYPEVELEDEPSNNIDPLILTWELLIKKKKQSQYERLRLLKHGEYLDAPLEEDELFNVRINKPNTKPTTTKPDTNLLTKKQILMRMEDDRETYKRSKETLWTVNRPKDSNFVSEDEFLVHYWNKMNPMDEDEDKALLDTFDELNNMIATSYKDKQF